MSRSKKFQAKVDKSNVRKKERAAFRERQQKRAAAERVRVRALDAEIASTWVFIEQVPAEDESVKEWEVVSIGSSSDEVRTWTEENEESSDDIHARQGAVAAELLMRMAQRKGQMSRERFMSLLTHFIRCTAQSTSQKDSFRFVHRTAYVLIPVKPYDREVQRSLQRMAELKGDMTTEKFTEYLKRLINPEYRKLSTLHKLPLEVRRIIYYHALVRNEPTYDIRSKPDSGKYIALLRTSRQISAEAAEVLYGENKFDFSGDRDWNINSWDACGGDCGWVYLESFLYTIGHQNRQHLRTIIVTPPDWSGLMKEDNQAAIAICDKIWTQGLLKVPTTRRDFLLGSFMSSCAVLAKLPNLLRICIVLDVGSDYLQFWIDEEPNEEQKTRKRYGTRLQKRFAAENKVLKNLVRTSSKPESNLTVSLVIAGDKATIPSASMASLKLKAEDLGIHCRL